MRIMGLDYGAKTVGVAISDALLLTAQGVETICRTQENKLRKTLARIKSLCEEYEVTEIVLGFPKNMNNTIGDRAEKSLGRFAEMGYPADTLEMLDTLLEDTGIEVHCFEDPYSLNELTDEEE